MRLRILSCLLSLAAGFDAAASDIYSTINRLRAGGGQCAVVKNLAALKPQAALERVAGNLARGNDLEQSLEAAGYRATRANALSITGDKADARAEELLARQSSYCRPLQDAAMTEVGVYLGARQVWIVTAAPFALSAGMSAQAAGERVLELVNQARATPRHCGDKAFKAAPPLRWNDTLAAASRLHAEDMARHNYFGHRGFDGSDPAQRVGRAGYRYRVTGENIAGGPMRPEDVVAGWINSPEHCANLMNPAFTEMGVAFAVDADSALRIYWTQAFGAPR